MKPSTSVVPLTSGPKKLIDAGLRESNQIPIEVLSIGHEALNECHTTHNWAEKHIDARLRESNEIPIEEMSIGHEALNECHASHIGSDKSHRCEVERVQSDTNRSNVCYC